MNNESSLLVIGGGVIGLSVAWELATRGRKVTLLEKHKIGKKASWAGAGILAPANSETATQPFDKLLGLGNDLHVQWHHRLLQLTGVDNGYRKCGGIYVAVTNGDKAALVGQQMNWSDYQIDFEVLKSDDPLIQPLSGGEGDCFIKVPGESQICNPKHLQALTRACELSGVDLLENCGELEFEKSKNRITSVNTNHGVFAADHVCFCTGAWSQQILERIGVRLPLIPVRGQMLLFKLNRPEFEYIVNVGPRYIVPREDGHVLAGSTLEEVGFDDSTTDEKIEELQRFATELVPSLTPQHRIREWSGLRPATHDGFPFIGRLSNMENVSVAAGHFRCGLQMAPASAVILADLIDKKPETIMDPVPFEPSRLDFQQQLEIAIE